jgi:hypothetical protein
MANSENKGATSDLTPDLEAWKSSSMLIFEYGRVLKEHSALAVSEKHLPASRENIKAALLLAMSQCTQNEEALHHLSAGYVLVGSFVSHDDAALHERFAHAVVASDFDTIQELGPTVRALQARIVLESVELASELRNYLLSIGAAA